MTKRRAPLTFELALTQVAALISWERAAEIVGKSHSAIRNWSDADTSAGVRMDAALALDVAYRAAGGDGAPFLHCYAIRLETETAAACLEQAALAAQAARAAREGGEAIEAAVLASRPGASLAELHRAESELTESIDAQTIALASVRTMLRQHNGNGAARAPEVAQTADA